MKVEKRDTDYCVYLSREDIFKLCHRISFEENPLLCGHYPSLCEEISIPNHKTDTKVLETLALTCTRDATVLSDEHCRDDIYFRFIEVYYCNKCRNTFLSDEWRDVCPYDNTKMKTIEKGPDVRVYTPKLASLLHDRNYLVTRYNAESKIWIFREDSASRL